MSTHKSTAVPVTKHHRLIALFLAADILAAALLVFGNYYFLDEAPIRGLSGGSVPLPQVQNNLHPPSHQRERAYHVSKIVTSQSLSAKDGLVPP